MVLTPEQGTSSSLTQAPKTMKMIVKVVAMGQEAEELIRVVLVHVVAV